MNDTAVFKPSILDASIRVRDHGVSAGDPQPVDRVPGPLGEGRVDFLRGGTRTRLIVLSQALDRSPFTPLVNGQVQSQSIDVNHAHTSRGNTQRDG